MTRRNLRGIRTQRAREFLAALTLLSVVSACKDPKAVTKPVMSTYASKEVEQPAQKSATAKTGTAKSNTGSTGTGATAAAPTTTDSTTYGSTAAGTTAAGSTTPGSTAPGTATPGSTTPATGAGAGTGTGTATKLTEGAKIYTERCSGCHGAVAESNKRGLKAAKIMDPYMKTFPKHFNVKWPDSYEAADVEQALAL